MEINPKQACRIYLITYSQVDLSKFPTRESFGNAIPIAFNSSSKVKPTHCACRMENHEDSESFHYNVLLALSGPKRWLEVKQGLQGLVLWFILPRMRVGITPHIGMYASMTMQCFTVRPTLI